MVALALATALLGCQTPATSPATQSQIAQPARPAPPKRVVAAITADPVALRASINIAGGATGAGGAGLSTVEELMHVGLATMDNAGRLQPRLAEAVPSAENGLWKVLPDGRMETTWKIRSNARWHDGVAFTADDIVFTAQVGSDPEVPYFRDAAYESVERVTAPDPQTVVITWKRPFIEADQAFRSAIPGSPLPKHLVASAYADDKSTLEQMPLWGPEFIGTGPFRLREFVRGSHVVLVANDSHALGRPKLDEIEVRFVPDPTTLQANVLAGTVELTFDRTVSLDQALQIRGEWKDGRVEWSSYLWMAIYPQFLNPRPTLVTDTRLRRALIQTIDRQELVDSLQAGLGTIAHSIRLPDEPEFEDARRAVVRYEYDPRAASAQLQQLGYSAGSDGVLRDASQQPLAFDLRYTSFEIETKTALAVADYWKRAGIAAEPVAIPQQRAQDREYFATYPAFLVIGNPDNLKALTRVRASQIPRPESSFVGQNWARYTTPEFEELLSSYFVTIPKGDRGGLVSRIVHHLTDELIWMSLYYRVEPTLIPNRIRNPLGRGHDSTQAWNAHEWEAVQ